MKTITTLEDLKTVDGNVVIAIGAFDGIHLGHQHVIRQAMELAKSEIAEPWVMTFDPHPVQVLQPDAAPKQLTPLKIKLELVENLGVAGCMVIPFTHDFANIEPEDFLDHLVRDIPGIKGIVVGENWRFGRKARGDVALLKSLAEKHTFNVYIADPVSLSGEIVSSSRIREDIKNGNFDRVTEMLGRRHILFGNVIHGQKRGRRLGFPTANLDLRGCALPPQGIYATIVTTDEGRYPGALYQPAEPEPQHGATEVYLLDYENDLYSHELHVELIEKIRDDDRRFEDDKDLIVQIRDDVMRVREIIQPLI